jgi:membrane protein
MKAVAGRRWRKPVPLMTARQVWLLFKEAYQEYAEDKVPRLGAALAFYTILSLVPLLIIAIAIAGAVFGPEAAQGEIVRQFDDLVGHQGAELINSLIDSVRPSVSGLTALGVITLIIGALGVFSQLQDALDTIWEVTPKPGRGWRDLLENRLIAFAMVLGAGFLLLVSLVLSASLAFLDRYLINLLPGWGLILRILNLGLSFLLPFGLFALMFRFLPDAKIAWTDVWLGAALTAMLFVIGKSVIGLYLGNAPITSIHGAAGSFVILLVWIYYSAQILFFGAEFTQVYMKHHGSGRVRPTENALPLTEAARAQQGIPHSAVVQNLAQDAAQDAAAQDKEKTSHG